MEFKTTYDEKNKIWYGTKFGIPLKDTDTVGTRILKVLQEAPDHIAQICAENGKKYTNREIANMTISIAKHLKTLDLQQCDIVGIYSKNNAYVAPICFGAMLVGLTISGLNPSFDDDSLINVCATSKPKIVFCDGKDYQKFEQILKECQLKPKVFTIQNHIDGVPNLQEFLDESSDCNNEFDELHLKFGLKQTVAILPTSGTTGIPKSVCITHEGILRTLIMPPIPFLNDVALNFAGLYWATGLAQVVLGTMFKQIRLITESPFSPKCLFELIEKYKVTSVFTPPYGLALAVGTSEIVNYDLSSVRMYWMGGGTLAPQLVERMKQFMKNAKFFIGYSLTEANAASIAFGLTRSDGGAGVLAFNAKVKIISRSGKSLGPGETGEICMYPSVYWPGYYNNPKATAEIQDSENWLRSGDLGYINKEGILFVSGRKIDLMTNNDCHFLPSEIEYAVYGLPNVVEACAFGVPDVFSGQLPAVAITIKQGSCVTEQDVCDHVAQKMPKSKHLRGGVYILDTLPKTITGKVKRREVALICAKMRGTSEV